MGGSGSGRWGWSHRKAKTVEDCFHLDVNRWMRDGQLGSGIYLTGAWTWTRQNYLTGETKSSISFEVDTRGDPPYARLMYKIGGNEINYKLPLETTPCTFGGVRWWFICPLAVNGHACGRRVGKLYLPPGATYFGCRHCHRLTYRSSQRSDKRVSAMLNNPAALYALAENMTVTPKNLFMYVKVMERLKMW